MFGKPEPLRLLFLEHVLRTSLPPVAWVVEHVVAEGERVLFFGEPATMKSWLLLHLGLHIAAGHKWLDFAVTAPRSVLYVDEEMTERLVRRRMQQLVAGGTPPAADGHFAVASREGVLFNERGGHTLLDQVWRANYKPEVVIIDSMRATLIGDENTQLDVIAFWRAVEPLLRAGLTIIVAHHMRKPRAEGPDAVRHRASGNTAIISGCDSAWAITRPGRAPAITVEAIKNGSTPISKRRGRVVAASLVWSVDNNKCPVNAALTAIPAVSLSRISPTIIISGSCRSIERKPSAKVRPVWLFTWI